MDKYSTSYGYFYKESAPEKGIYIELPHGHNHEQRLNAASKKDIEWDMCLFYYNDGGDTYYTNNYGDEGHARAIDRDANHHYSVDRETFEKKVTSTILPG
jgi:hypothetical protein